jgi:hypothetical protein
MRLASFCKLYSYPGADGPAIVWLTEHVHWKLEPRVLVWERCWREKEKGRSGPIDVTWICFVCVTGRDCLF